MKFQSKFGLGEIVCTERKVREDIGKLHLDQILKIIAITFDVAGVTTYVCRNAEHGNTVVYFESELIGDPAYDQEKGAYPETDLS